MMETTDSVRLLNVLRATRPLRPGRGPNPAWTLPNQRIARDRGFPEVRKADNGPEVSSLITRRWAAERGIRQYFIDLVNQRRTGRSEASVLVCATKV